MRAYSNKLYCSCCLMHRNTWKSAKKSARQLGKTEIKTQLKEVDNA